MFEVYARKMVVCILNVHVEDTVCLVLFRVRSVCKEDGCLHTKCTRRRHGVPCSFSCSKWNGVTCGNSKEPEIGDDAD